MTSVKRIRKKKQQRHVFLYKINVNKDLTDQFISS